MFDYIKAITLRVNIFGLLAFMFTLGVLYGGVTSNLVLTTASGVCFILTGLGKGIRDFDF